MSTSAKYPVSASSAVCRMVLRNVSDQMLCNVAEHASEMVRNVAEQVRNVSGQVCSEMIRNVSDRKLSSVGGFRTRVRNVSDSGSGMVPDVGHQVPLLTDVGGQVGGLGTNFISL